eukprot:2949666-Rhodomonas_salina.1
MSSSGIAHAPLSPMRMLCDVRYQCDDGTDETAYGHTGSYSGKNRGGRYTVCCSVCTGRGMMEGSFV